MKARHFIPGVIDEHGHRTLRHLVPNPMKWLVDQGFRAALTPGSDTQKATLPLDPGLLSFIIGRDYSSVRAGLGYKRAGELRRGGQLKR
jgi:hypothetical protein